MRLPPIVITIADDMLGKPYVTIESDPEHEESPLRGASPVRLTVWTDSVRVEDHRRKKD